MDIFFEKYTDFQRRAIIRKGKKTDLEFKNQNIRLDLVVWWWIDFIAPQLRERSHSNTQIEHYQWTFYRDIARYPRKVSLLMTDGTDFIFILLGATLRTERVPLGTMISQIPSPNQAGRKKWKSARALQSENSLQDDHRENLALLKKKIFTSFMHNSLIQKKISELILHLQQFQNITFVHTDLLEDPNCRNFAYIQKFETSSARGEARCSILD